MIAKARFEKSVPETMSIPVICVGNIVVGGAGKTPTVGLICEILKNHSMKPHVISSGYGGYVKNVIKVDTKQHSYLQVGDEALISAEHSPTWVGKNRAKAAKAAIIGGADFIVMDDGFQSRAIEQDLKILVINSLQQFGNEKLFPAGPLREPIGNGIDKADIIIMTGGKNEELIEHIRKYRKNIPIYCTSIEAVKDLSGFKTNKVVAFCGLGYPEKFRSTLQDCGLEVLELISFSDHHPYTITEIQKMLNAANSIGAELVTTQKDWVKIPEVFKENIRFIKIKFIVESEEFEEHLLDFLSNVKQKKLSQNNAKNI